MNKQFSATVSYSPVFHLTLNKDIVDLIVEKGLNHYDGTCRAACKQGGFIYGWRNCVNCEATCTASFRELDLTLKILEDFCGGLEEARISLEYKKFIKDLLDSSNQEKVLMPSELTAENGAKYIFLGEFSEERTVPCSECHECDEEEVSECEACNGEGEYILKVPVGWDTIKNIYALAVEKLSIK